MQVLLPGGDVKAFGNVLITSGDMVIEARKRSSIERPVKSIYYCNGHTISNIRVF
jgi:hypothetical protein